MINALSQDRPYHNEVLFTDGPRHYLIPGTIRHTDKSAVEGHRERESDGTADILAASGIHYAIIVAFRILNSTEVSKKS